MPLVRVTLIENVFSDGQKQEIVSRLTEAMVSIAGESLRPVTSVLIEEIQGQEWAITGRAQSAVNIHPIALACM